MHKSKTKKFVDKYVFPPLVAAAALAVITISAIAIPVLKMFHREERIHPRRRK